MAIGLDDVVAAETALSDVDGLAGRLIIRGDTLRASEPLQIWSGIRPAPNDADRARPARPANPGALRAIGRPEENCKAMAVL